MEQQLPEAVANRPLRTVAKNFDQQYPFTPAEQSRRASRSQENDRALDLSMKC